MKQTTPTKINFFTRSSHYMDHMAPIWPYIPERMKGQWVIAAKDIEAAHKNQIPERDLHIVRGQRYRDGIPIEDNGLMLVSAAGDMTIAKKHCPGSTHLAMMEHGVGLVFPNNAAYAGNIGSRRFANLFLAPNSKIQALTARKFPQTPNIIIGTPKMQLLRDFRKNSSRDRAKEVTVAIGFHWDGNTICPEAGNCFDYYREWLPMLNAKWKLIGHCHPREVNTIVPYYESMGIEYVADFEDVVRRADVYVNDCSPTMYEAAALGIPVVILNKPEFRREVDFGIRFWDYTDIGPHVNHPEELMIAIEAQLQEASASYYYAKMAKVRNDLYPFMDAGGAIAARELVKYVNKETA